MIANGVKLYDRGIQRLSFRMPDGTGLVLPMRCTEASKPLVAVTDLAKLGWKALFGPGSGQLECISTGVRHQLQMDRGVWVLRVRLELPQPPGGLVVPVGPSAESAPWSWRRGAATPSRLRPACLEGRSGSGLSGRAGTGS